MDSVAQEAVRECEEELKGTRLEQPRLFYNRKDGYVSAPHLGQTVGGSVRLTKVQVRYPHCGRHRFGYWMAYGVPLCRLVQ